MAARRRLGFAAGLEPQWSRTCPFRAPSDLFRTSKNRHLSAVLRPKLLGGKHNMNAEACCSIATPHFEWNLEDLLFPGLM